jgi:hypothetical protein
LSGFYLCSKKSEIFGAFLDSDSAFFASRYERKKTLKLQLKNVRNEVVLKRTF